MLSSILPLLITISSLGLFPVITSMLRRTITGRLGTPREREQEGVSDERERERGRERS